jgi:hypothetical protein
MYTIMCPAMHNRGGAPLEVNADGAVGGRERERELGGGVAYQQGNEKVIKPSGGWTEEVRW